MKRSPLFRFAAIFAFVLGLATASRASAAQMGFVSDTIGDSRPATSTIHTIAFQVPDAIPPSGSLKIAFETQQFVIDPAFNFADVSFAYSTTSRTTGFVGRSLAASADVTHDGVAGNPPTGPVNITLSSGSGIPAGAYMSVVFGATDIVNPTSTGSYRILLNTYSATGTAIDYGAAMVAILPAVGVDVNQNVTTPANLSNGLPTGTIPSNITGVLLSVNTDIFSTCRYATSSGVTYDNMTNFFAHDSLGIFHTATVLLTVVQGTTYDYYVRCDNFAGIKNTTDYVIAFTGGQPTGVPPGGGTVPNPSGGAGGPSYPPYPPTPILPSLVIQGVTLPNQKVQVLEDGSPVSQSAQTDGQGNFSVTIPSLAQGTYSFTLYIVDGNGNWITSRTFTMTVIAGSSNSVQGIVLPPSIALSTTTVPLGGTVTFLGYAPPSSTVAISVVSQDGMQPPVNATTYAAAQDGSWSYKLKTAGFAVDTYQVKVETAVPGLAVSGYSTIQYLGVGTSPVRLFHGADINGDGKVNLADFSILLFYWGKNYPPAELSGGSTVGLPDLSILLYYWTG